MSLPEDDQRLQQAAEKGGFPVAAAEMVLNCLAWTPYNPDAIDGHLSASEFCRTFLESVMDTHLEKTVETMHDWKIERSEDLGRIVYSLAEFGLVKPDENDRIEDFANVFDLREQRFAWNTESEADRLDREERTMKSIMRVMMTLGGLAAIACFAAVPWTESPIMLIAIGVTLAVVPALLYLLAMHGYRKVRDEDSALSRTDTPTRHT